MKWVDRDELSNYHTVSDFEELLHVLDDDSLQEFQYIVDDNEWNIRLREPADFTLNADIPNLKKYIFSEAVRVEKYEAAATLIF